MKEDMKLSRQQTRKLFGLEGMASFSFSNIGNLCLSILGR